MKKILLFALMIVTHHHIYAQAGEWTWMKGSSTYNSSGTFGTLGVPDAANNPPSLYEPYEWTDLQGNLWLFGGYDGGFHFRSALWKFDPSSNEWTWMHGSSNLDLSPVYGTQGVPSASNDPGGRFSGATWVDTAGNLFLFGGFYMPGYATDLWKYDISTDEWTWMKGPNTGGMPGIYGTLGVESSSNYPGYRAEVNSAWTDNDGNLWLFGGGDNGGVAYGDLWRYNPATNNWTWINGSNTPNAPAVYGTKGVADPSNSPGGRMVYSRWKDASGNFWFYGGRNSSWSIFNDLWKYDVASNEWTWMSGTSNLNSSGNYGTLCSADSDYISSNRTENRGVWTDGCGNFWFFGGASTYYSSYYSDLWVYHTLSNEWVLAKGTNTANLNGTYGTQGVSDPANIPPGLWGSSSWTDHDGNLWLFGGSALWGSFTNALWRFVPDPNCGSCTVQNVQPSFASSDTDICEKFCINFFDSSQNNPTAWQWLFPGGAPSSSSDQNPINICYDVPGIYDVTLITTGANGVDTLTLSNFVTVYATPPFPTITQVGYTLTSSPASSYQWQLNAIDIPGATNQSYTVLQTGYYTVLITDANGCKNSVTEYILISGINDAMSDTNIFIYPNPVTDGLMVELLNVFAGDEIMFAICNAIGQEIFSSIEIRTIVTSSFKKEIDLSKAEPGVYFLEIKTTKDFFRKKIIKLN